MNSRTAQPLQLVEYNVRGDGEEKSEKKSTFTECVADITFTFI